jgi:hypothetical protein
MVALVKEMAAVRMTSVAVAADFSLTSTTGYLQSD